MTLSIALALAVAAASASAQWAGGDGDGWNFDSCVFTSTHYSAHTSTADATSTWCPECDATSVYTTQWPTVFSTFCATGLEPVTYTITSSYTGASNAIDPTGIPSGFTTTVSTCTVCGDKPITATLTVCTDPAIAPTYTTTYDTVYPTFGSTGLVPKTYTVTETCTGAPAPPDPTHIPSGFQTTVATCDTCGPKPIIATLTVPSDSARPNPDYTTTYQRTYSKFGPSGLEPATYTVVESGYGNPTPHHGVPYGFKAAISVCTTCGPEPITATITGPAHEFGTGPATTEAVTETVSPVAPGADDEAPTGDSHPSGDFEGAAPSGSPAHGGSSSEDSPVDTSASPSDHGSGSDAASPSIEPFLGSAPSLSMGSALFMTVAMIFFGMLYL